MSPWSLEEVFLGNVVRGYPKLLFEGLVHALTQVLSQCFMNDSSYQQCSLGLSEQQEAVPYGFMSATALTVQSCFMVSDVQQLQDCCPSTAPDKVQDCNLSF